MGLNRDDLPKMTRVMRTCGLAGAVLAQMFLLSCTGARDAAVYPDVVYPRFAPHTGALDQMAASEQQVRQYMAGNTVLSFAPRHGTQIEYTDRFGNAYLWYPGNSDIIAGRWQTLKQGNTVAVCFLYPFHTVNPVTPSEKGRWRCAPARATFIHDYERVRGNPFRLRPGAAPLRLPRQTSVTFSQLARQLGVPPSRLERLAVARNFPPQG